MVAICSSETSVDFQETEQLFIPEQGTLFSYYFLFIFFLFCFSLFLCFYCLYSILFLLVYAIRLFLLFPILFYLVRSFISLSSSFLSAFLFIYLFICLALSFLSASPLCVSSHADYTPERLCRGGERFV
jgi:hypothetical protein